MFNGMFGNSNERDCGGGCGFGNCTWIILILLFVCCCCKGGDKGFHLHINPCCLIPIIALAFCCGGIGVHREC